MSTIESEKTCRLTDPGRFVTGCNYWASHAGTRMWSDWRPEQIEQDLDILGRQGIMLQRVFPLWPEFQPISLLRTARSTPVECRFGEEPLPDTESGRAGVSDVMIARFEQFLDILSEHKMTCIVGLLTGWMSGRLYVPPALEGLNPITDPMAIRWEVRFVRYFVQRFKHHPAVAAWELGNECNCMGTATRDEAANWTALIAGTVRAIDPSRPFISGMHGLTPEGTWSILDQAEHVDMLTTHPYPIFTPHCGHEPLDTIRPILHGTAESRYYADLGGKPCLCEELGTLGDMIASEEIAAKYVSGCLSSLWANDCHGLVWWCAADQTELVEAPYDWNGVERELGLFRVDRSTKPVAAAFANFSRFLASLPFKTLPRRSCRAVCILTKDQDHWAVAYASFILAKQAGFDIEFQYADQPLKDAELYLMPSIKGGSVMTQTRLKVLYEKIRSGSTLYLSHDDGILSGFESLIGLEPQSRDIRTGEIQIKIDGLGEVGGAFLFEAPRRLNLKATRAQVLGTEPNGNPAFSVAEYGKGKVYFLSAPMEKALTLRPHAFDDDQAKCWQIYRLVGQEILQKQVVTKHEPTLAVTEHALSSDQMALVVINLSPEENTDTLTLQDGWKLSKCFPEDGTARVVRNAIAVVLKANDVAVYIVDRK